MQLTRTATAAFAAASITAAATAHDGRRFDIQIHADQLWAQGYISGHNPTDDGGGITRPYMNAIHGHWSNNPAPTIDAASATLPGFDLFAGGDLTGFDLSITLNGASKWVSPPHNPPAGTVPNLVPLKPGEEIFVGFGGGFVTTQAPGSLTLIPAVSPSGLLDIDLTYDIGIEPAGTIFVLEFTLSSSNAAIAESETIHVILSPDGNGPMERLHHAALYLEAELGITPGGCNPADLDASDTLDLSDVQSFLIAFAAQDPIADLAPASNPDGVFNLADVQNFLIAFGQGCP